MWSVSTGALLLTRPHGGPVTGVAFSPDGRLIASAGGKALRLWAAAGGLKLRAIPFPRAVRGVSFSPDGAHFVVVSNEPVARVYSSTGALVDELKHDGEVTSAAFGPGGRTVVTGSRDRTARVWQLDSDDFTKLEGHTGQVLDVAFSPRGDQVATGSTDGSARVWRTSDGDRLHVPRRSLESRHDDRVQSGRGRRSRRRRSTARRGSGAGNLSTRGQRAAAGARRPPPTDVAFTPDGRDGRSRRARTARPASVAPGRSTRSCSHPWAGTARPVRRGRRRPGRLDSSCPPTASGATRVARHTWRSRRPSRCRARPRSVTVVRGCALSGTASSRSPPAAQDGVARLWRVRRRQRRCGSFAHGAARRERSAFARGSGRADRDRPARTGSRASGTATAGRLRRSALYGAGGIVAAVAFSPDGAIARDRRRGPARARVWRLSDAPPARGAPGRARRSDITSIAYSPDGQLPRDVEPRRRRPRLGARETPGARCGCCAGTTGDGERRRPSAPDGRWVATAGPTSVGVWEPVTGRRIDAGTPELLLRGHAAGARGAGRSAPSRSRAVNGSASAGDDGTVRTYRCELCGNADAASCGLPERRLDGIGRTLTPDGAHAATSARRSAATCRARAGRACSRRAGLASPCRARAPGRGWRRRCGGRP